MPSPSGPTDAGAAELAGTVGGQIIALARVHRTAVAAALMDLGLHVGQEFVLQLLWEQDGRSHAEIGRAVGVEASTVTKAVSRMERSGLVERRPDSADARVSRVWLTARGRDLHDDVVTRWRAVEHQMLDGLADDDVASLRRAVSRMHHNLHR